MFNIKFPIRLIIFLIFTVIVNVFSTVTIEYNAISFQEYRNVEIICGNLFDVIQTTDITDVSKDLRVNWRSCREKAFTIIITSGISLTFLVTLLMYLFYLYRNRPKREDWIEDYFMQIAAYCMAHDYVYNSQIKQGVIMICTPDLYYQEFKVSGAELRRWKHKFLKRLSMYHDLQFDEKEKAKVNITEEDFKNEQ